MGIDSWDNEAAIVQVNGKTCFNKKLAAGSGKQLCGQKHNGWNEEKIKVTCTGDANSKGEFTVRVYAQLNSVRTTKASALTTLCSLRRDFIVCNMNCELPFLLVSY